MKQFSRLLIIFFSFIFICNHIRCQVLDSALYYYKGEVFSFIERMPVWHGGDHEMKAYINSILTYPESAKKDKIEGTVVVEFVVDSNGYIKFPKLVHGISTDCDNEALKLVRNFPRWDPGIHNGKPVNARFTLPVRFKLP